MRRRRRILAGSNRTVLGILRAVRSVGLRIPRDLSVLVSDDIPAFEFIDPPLTVLSQAPAQIGRVAARLLLDRLAGGPPATELIPMRLVERASVGPRRTPPTEEASHERDRATCGPIPLQYPEPNDSDRLRCVTLVRVDTEDGARAGASASRSGRDSAVRCARSSRRASRRYSSARIAREPRRLWERMRDQTFWYGRGGIASFAISAIDSALWDLAGKLAGLPVHRLLGGAVHDRFRACASIIWDPGDLDVDRRRVRRLRRARLHRREGRLGPRPGDGLRDGRTPRRGLRQAVRDAVGPDFGLAVDVSGRVRWTARTRSQWRAPSSRTT